VNWVLTASSKSGSIEIMKNKNQKQNFDDKIMVDESFVQLDSANVTPKLKKDGTIITAGFRDMLSSLRDFVVVGGDFV